MKSSPALIDKVREHESFREYAYPDPASPLARECRNRGYKPRWGFKPAKELIDTLPEDLRKLHGNPWTVGYGETLGVRYDTRWSKDEAHRHLLRRLQEFETEVLALCEVDPNPNQCAALVSFAYNVGVGNLRKSSVLKAHNRGDFQAAARAFGLWNKAQGQVLAGLTRRRADEAALYLKPWVSPSATPEEVEEVEGPVSQAVEPERPMTQSTINKASALAGGTAAIAAATEVVNTVNNFRAGVESLGNWLVPVILVVTVAAAGWAIWERTKQRREGWA